MANKINIEFSGTVAELEKLLSGAFPNKEALITASFNTVNPPIDPLFTSLIDFCANSGVKVNYSDEVYAGFCNARDFAKTYPNFCPPLLEGSTL